MLAPDFAVHEATNAGVPVGCSHPDPATDYISVV